MVLSWKFLAKRMAGGFPLKRFMPLMPVGLPLDHAHPEPSHRQALLPPGPRPAPFLSGAALQSDRGRFTQDIRSYVRGTASFQNNLGEGYSCRRPIMPLPVTRPRKNIAGALVHLPDRAKLDSNSLEWFG